MDIDLQSPRHQVRRPGDLPEGHAPAAAADARLRAPAVRRWGGRCGSGTCWCRGSPTATTTSRRSPTSCAGLKTVERVEILRFHQMGTRQVAQARPRVPAGERRAARRCVDRARAQAVPQPWVDPDGKFRRFPPHPFSVVIRCHSQLRIQLCLAASLRQNVRERTQPYSRSGAFQV